MQPSRYFYRDLITQTVPVAELLGQVARFRPVPRDWSVIVIDVEGSTLAVGAGRHHEVNLAATGGIIAVLNRIKEHHEGLLIPYFFGGDGATFLVPGYLEQELVEILEHYRHHVSRNFALVLRVGAVAVTEVYRRGPTIRMAKLRLNEVYTMPVVLGNGLKRAEDLIKADFNAGDSTPLEVTPVDLTGMECRWDEIDPSGPEERVVCLLVTCDDEARQARVYRAVMTAIDRTFGPLDVRQPITVGRLRLRLGIGTIRREMSAALGRFSLKYLASKWLSTLFGPYYFTTEAGKNYLARISDLSTTLMLDGNINSVITGTGQQIAELTAFLEAREAAGELTFGIHTTHAAVMSCYVRDHDRDHIHFVDGTEGGYTTAARMFKAKLAGRR